LLPFRILVEFGRRDFEILLKFCLGQKGLDVRAINAVGQWLNLAVSARREGRKKKEKERKEKRKTYLQSLPGNDKIIRVEIILTSRLSYG
jgi:hypothetical protein